MKEELDQLKSKVERLEQIVDIFVRPERYVFERPITGGTAGLKIGDTAGKIGMFGTTPVSQQVPAGIILGMTVIGGATVTESNTFAGNSAGTGSHFTIHDIVAALQNIGILAQ